jgi:hypothetical protein
MTSGKLSGLRQAAPALTLLVSSAVIVELLFGSTHLTIISALIPEIGFYGCAALLIRYFVRRQHRGWVSILLLGLAFAVFEEFLVVQTSVSPALFVGLGSAGIYGRMFGANWVYFLWAVGYESVWAIVLPVYLTELVFRSRREDPWLGKRGLTTAAVLFTLASVVSWYIWTQVVAPAAIGSIYSPPLSLMILASTMIVGLGVVALGPRPTLRSSGGTTRAAPRPWMVGSIAVALGLLWFVLVAFAYSLFPAIPAAVAIAAGLALAGAALFAIRRLSASTGWGDAHRLAMVFGGLAASMLAGFWASGIVLEVDFVGKGVFDAVAIILMSYLAWTLHDRGRGLGDAAAPTGKARSLVADGVLLGRLKLRSTREPGPT